MNLWSSWDSNTGPLNHICMQLYNLDHFHFDVPPLPFQAFLTCIACNPTGARELISLNSLVYLSECHVIDIRPDYHGNGHALVPPSSLHSTAAGFVPTVSARYRQLFFPLLKFLLALLTCTGPQQKEACSQVTTLIGAHSDVFVVVLKEQKAHVSIATLQELALVTAVIGHSKVGKL